MDRFDPFVKYADVYGDVINWEKDPMNKPQNQNKYFFSDGKTYYEQICKMLRLMSVFKQAFNQIYDNEEEIHTAWENFVDNLSATAVYGEEVGVNLTWTDTSVNFAFTIPGGEDGVGIQSITFNSDYTMTITLTDGQTYTSDSLRGPQGEQGIQGIQGPAGPQGEPGSGLEILDVYPTLQDLQTAHPTGSPGDAYQVGTAPSYTLYIWSASQSAWVPAGTIGSSVPSSADPLMDGTASAGISDLYSRGDHVHPTDTSRASAQDLQTVDNKVDAVDDRVDDLNDFINTSQKLIDQRFVYRESPAEHDGLAVLDKIKGHTVKFNQIVPINTLASATVNGVTWTNNGDGSIIANGTATANSAFSGGNWNTVSAFSNDLKSRGGHKLYINPNAKNGNENVRLNAQGFVTDGVGISVTEPMIIQLSNNIATFNTVQIYPIVINGNTATNFSIKPYILDLTAMGIDNLTTVDQVEAWLSQNLGLLDYYAYTPGTLIPFKGMVLKTTGKNLYVGSPSFDDFINRDKYTLADETYNGHEVIYKSEAWYGVRKDILVKANVTYTFSSMVKCSAPTRISIYNKNADILEWKDIGTEWTRISGTFTPSQDTVERLRVESNNDNTIYLSEYQLEIGSSATEYEPYTESTLSLEILNTLFPTGMKDVPDYTNSGMIYDEATEKKANTKIGRVNLENLSWSLRGDYWQTQSNIIPDAKKPSDNVQPINAIHSVFEIKGGYYVQGTNQIGMTTTGVLNCNNGSTTDKPTGYLFYELETPIEQDIDLDLSFKAYQDGTEQLLPVNGATPTTSSLLADMTYFSINDAMDYILAKLDQVPSSIASDINSLKIRMTSAEDDITSLGDRMTTAEGNITSLGGRMTTAEGNITSLAGRMTTAEGNISDNASDIGNLQTSLDTLEGRVDDLEASEIKVVQRTLTIGNISAGGSSQGSMPVQSETGYDMIGIVGSKAVRGTFDSNYTVETGFRVVLSGSTNYVYYKIFNLNSSSAAENVELTVDILCKKQSN